MQSGLFIKNLLEKKCLYIDFFMFCDIIFKIIVNVKNIQMFII